MQLTILQQKRLDFPPKKQKKNVTTRLKQVIDYRRFDLWGRQLIRTQTFKTTSKNLKNAKGHVDFHCHESPQELDLRTAHALNCGSGLKKSW
jgi:hypothetical protein